MKRFFGVEYGTMSDLSYVNDSAFTVFPLFMDSNIVKYYIESKKKLILEMITRVILKPYLSKGRIRDIKVKFFIPTSDAHQKILSITKSHDSLNIIKDNNDNLIGVFELDVIPARKTEIIVVKEVMELTQFKVINYEEIKLSRREPSEQKFKLSSEIIEVTKELRASNDLTTIINCIRFIKSRVRYVKNYFRLGALFALKHRKGACDEITDLCATILYALGYNVRVVIGYVIGSGFHAWLEVLSKNNEWIPIDPTAGLIGGIGLRWIKIYSEAKQNQKIIHYNARPKRLRVSLEYYLEGEKLI